MKKIIVCALTVCSLASCANNQSSNTDIIGKWAMDDTSFLPSNIDGVGFILSADGSGSIYEDISSILHFTSNGLDVGGTVFGDEFLSSSGDVISFDIADQKFLTMKRLTFGNSRYDGTYSLTGGMLYDNMASSMADMNDLSIEDLNITLEFDGSHSEIVFNDVFTYTARGKVLTVEGITGFFDTDSKGWMTYDIDGNKLTTKGKQTQTHTRVE